MMEKRELLKLNYELDDGQVDELINVYSKYQPYISFEEFLMAIRKPYFRPTIERLGIDLGIDEPPQNV